MHIRIVALGCENLVALLKKTGSAGLFFVPFSSAMSVSEDLIGLATQEKSILLQELGFQRIIILGPVDTWHGIKEGPLFDFCTGDNLLELEFRIKRLACNKFYDFSWGKLICSDTYIEIDGTRRYCELGLVDFFKLLLRSRGYWVQKSAINTSLGLGVKSRLPAVYVSRLRRILSSFPGIWGHDIILSGRQKGYLLIL